MVLFLFVCALCVDDMYVSVYHASLIYMIYKITNFKHEIVLLI